MKNKSETYTNIPEIKEIDLDNYGFPRTRSGNLTKENGLLNLLEKHDSYKDKFYYDSFLQKVMSKIFISDRENKDWNDEKSIEFLAHLQSCGLKRLEAQMLERCIRTISKRNACSIAKEELSKLVWDNSGRVENFFANICGCEDSQYSKAVSEYFWIGLVARILDPGHKVDSMVVIEGVQGTKKSSLIEAIGYNKYAGVASGKLGDKDFHLSLRGKYIVEFAELNSLEGASVNTIKRVVSQRVDNFREPFGRISTDHPRQCIFIGTSNQDVYLKDPTGNRRFLPIRATKIDIDKFVSERDQYFAEAIQLFRTNKKWYELDDSLVKIQQGLRFDNDVWEEPLLNQIKKIDYICTHDALLMLGIPIEKMDSDKSKRVREILTRNRWTYVNNKIANDNSRRKSYRNPDISNDTKSIRDLKNIFGIAKK